MVDNIFAYETNGGFYIHLNSFSLLTGAFIGFGGRYVMDDTNVPVNIVPLSSDHFFDWHTFPSKSLLSLPYLGFLEKTNPAYVVTRKMILSAKNPYFAAGKTFNGAG